MMKFYTFLILFVAAFNLPVNANEIDDKLISVFRLPQNAYSKISVLACLARLNKNQNTPDLDKSINLLEMELVSDIAYLDYTVKKYPDNSEYPKYVLDKIVVGFREGYFKQTTNLKSENLVVSYENNTHVNLKEIYENIKLDPKNEAEFKKWFEKYFPKK